MSRIDKPRTEYIYDAKVLAAILEPVADGRWRLIVKRREVGVYPSRQAALEALDEQEGER
jgi:hypothetical protein